MEGYKLGESDAKNKRLRVNPFCDNSEKDDGYEDGYFDNYIGYYVEYQHESPGSLIERRYFKLSNSAISFAGGIKGAQVRNKTE